MGPAVLGTFANTLRMKWTRHRCQDEPWNTVSIAAIENQALIDHVTALAATRGASPAQVALAWLLAQRPYVVPIPGTRRRERIDENAAATTVGLSADDIADLNSLVDRLGVAGNRYDDAGMGMVGR